VPTLSSTDMRKSGRGTASAKKLTYAERDETSKQLSA
jgi:hypothetical protein